MTKSVIIVKDFLRHFENSYISIKFSAINMFEIDMTKKSISGCFNNQELSRT